MTSLFDELRGENTPLVCLSEETIDPFLIGGCKDALELATMHYMAICEPAQLFTYGPRQGLEGFRVALADFLRAQYDDDISSDNLMVSGGSTQSLTLICNILFEKGDTVFVEEPISPKELAIMTALGLKLIPVPTDKDGINLDELGKELSKVKKHASKPFCAGLFLTPCYQNPTGICLVAEKCNQLVELMSKYNCLCISNDVYQCLSYDKGKAPFGPPPKRLISYDINRKDSTNENAVSGHVTSKDSSNDDALSGHVVSEDSTNENTLSGLEASKDSTNKKTLSGHVVSIGSFSTIFCPGVRMGWIEAPPNVMEFIKNSPFVSFTGASQQYLSGVMESVFGLGILKDSFESIRLTLHTRMERVCEAIAEKLPQCTFTKPKGGIFIWLTLPSGIDSEELLELCKEKYKVDFSPGNAFSSTNKKFKNNLRLSTSRYGDQTLIKAITRLGEALNELLQENKQGK